MAKCTKEKELTIITEDKVGMLEEVTRTIAKAGINIIALCVYAMEGSARFMLITNDERRAKQAAEARGWKTEEKDVAVVEIHNEVGAGNEIAERIKSKNINIHYCYGSTSFTLADCPCALVIRCDNPDAVCEAVL